MLYDQAQLVSSYVDAYQVTGEEFFADIARRTCDYVLRDLTSPAGGFYSAEDADSEGVEGKFYVWTLAEIENILGEKSEAFCPKKISGEDENNEDLTERTRKRGRQPKTINSVYKDNHPLEVDDSDKEETLLYTKYFLLLLIFFIFHIVFKARN